MENILYTTQKELHRRYVLKENIDITYLSIPFTYFIFPIVRGYYCEFNSILDNIVVPIKMIVALKLLEF